jgi:transposase
LPESIEGVATLHELVASHAEEPRDVAVGTETDRGFFVGAMIACGYAVYAVNPLAASRYRDRHGVSGAKSDPGDAKMLADLVRTDRHNHRQVAGDTADVEALKVLARAHQSLIWSRQRQTAALRSTLREFYPAALACFGEDLQANDSLSVLGRAPSPEQGRKLSMSQIEAVLRGGGRMRLVTSRAKEIQGHLRGSHLELPQIVAQAFGSSVSATVAIISEINRQIATLEAELTKHFEQHPDAEIIRSLPGLGPVLGARVLGEFGDDPNRYDDAKSRKNYAGTSPVTRASGTKRIVVARFVRNKRLGDACYWWAFSSIKTSPGARALYDSHRANGDNHHQALRALANRLVGILHGCLKHRMLYDENVAWPKTGEKTAA